MTIPEERGTRSLESRILDTRLRSRFAKVTKSACTNQKLQDCLAAGGGMPDDHLLFGVSSFVAESIVEKVLFPTFDRSVHFRKKGKKDWITELHGYDEQAGSQTGYDLALCIRAWHKRKKLDDFSAAEVYMASMVSEDQKKGLGYAEIYVSHVQSEPWKHTLRFVSEHRYPDHSLLWIDYFIIRQCRPDFNLDYIVSIIPFIGQTMIVDDDKKTYFKRLFCVFEVATGGKDHAFAIRVSDRRQGFSKLRARYQSRGANREHTMEAILENTIGCRKLLKWVHIVLVTLCLLPACFISAAFWWVGFDPPFLVSDIARWSFRILAGLFTISAVVVLGLLIIPTVDYIIYAVKARRMNIVIDTTAARCLSEKDEEEIGEYILDIWGSFEKLNERCQDVFKAAIINPAYRLAVNETSERAPFPYLMDLATE